MDLKVVLAAVFVFLMCPVHGLWWAMGSPVVIDPNSICKKTRRLRGKQLEICTKEKDIVNETFKGAQLSTKECQFQFRNRPWNCSTERRSLRRLLARDTRETSFAHAITAAGVTCAIVRACSTGEYLGCTCNRNRGHTGNSEWHWDGCNENIEYGYKKARDFLDPRKSPKKAVDVKTLLLLHNNEAGRLAVKRYMKTDCKCHGLSGSCATKTCWEKMPPFREVGYRLMDRYNGASKVIPGNDGKSVIPEGRTIKPPEEEDLIYTEESPDYCDFNNATGTLGTKGRECNYTSTAVDGCEILCCGRGARRQIVREKENCKCRFKWCCEVSCEVCNITRTISRCY